MAGTFLLLPSFPIRHEAAFGLPVAGIASTWRVPSVRERQFLFNSALSISGLVSRLPKQRPTRLGTSCSNYVYQVILSTAALSPGCLAICFIGWACCRLHFQFPPFLQLVPFHRFHLPLPIPPWSFVYSNISIGATPIAVTMCASSRPLGAPWPIPRQGATTYWWQWRDGMGFAWREHPEHINVRGRSAMFLHFVGAPMSLPISGVVFSIFRSPGGHLRPFPRLVS